MSKIVLFPPPSFYSETDYAGGPAYVRCLAGANWADEVYVLPSPEDPCAPVRFERSGAKSAVEISREKPRLACRDMLLRLLPKTGKLAMGYTRETLRLAGYLRRFSGDATAIHINGVGCEVAAIAAKLSGFKHVFGTVHNLPGEDVEAFRWIRRLIEYVSFRCCDHLVFPSRLCLEQWSRRVRIPMSHAVIYHGCRPEAFSHGCEREDALCRLGLRAHERSDLVLGIAGRLHACKGHEVLLRAIAEVADRVPLWVLVAGHGPRQQALEALVAQLEISEQVTFLGQCTDMSAFYRAIDINVLPSLSEGLGYSVVEGMHAGLPQIVSDAGGMTELVRESGAGIVFPSGDSGALAAAILHMHECPEYMHARGREARDYAGRELTEDRMLAKTFAFYEESLGIA